MTESIELSIIIVNWNSVEFLRSCLASIFRNVVGITFEVLVIDNASGDGCMEMLQHEFPQVQGIQSADNLGFARANNLCFARSRGEIALFLNPDTEVVGAALQTMARVLQRNPKAAVAGARLLNSDLSVQTSCIQRFPTLLNQLLDSDWLRRRFPSASLWGTSPLESSSQDPVAVEAVSGACLAIRRTAFQEAGGFDEGYFMYSEDIDLCYTVQRNGSACYYVPEAVVVHHGGRSSEKQTENHFAAIRVRDSVLRFMDIHHGRIYGVAYRATVALSALVRLCLVPVIAVGNIGRNASTAATASRWLALLRWALLHKAAFPSKAPRGPLDARCSQPSTGLQRP